MRVHERLALWGSFVKFSHSVFALPFALIMLLVLSRSYPFSWLQVLTILFAVVAARTAAMAFNRIADASFDALNPRTAGRELPSARLSYAEAWWLTSLSVVVFAAAAALLGYHCLIMVPPVVAVLFGYSLLKRVTSMCHFVLGIALSLAPGGVWYAITATWAWEPLWLMAAVLTWVAGFDILYSCQDIEIDRKLGLLSVPRYIGFRGAQGVAVVLHISTAALLFRFGVVFELHTPYNLGVSLFSALLLSQHWSVARRGVGCIDQVFFTRNGLASIALLFFVVLDLCLK